LKFYEVMAVAALSYGSEFCKSRRLCFHPPSAANGCSTITVTFRWFSCKTVRQVLRLRSLLGVRQTNVVTLAREMNQVQLLSGRRSARELPAAWGA